MKIAIRPFALCILCLLALVGCSSTRQTATTSRPSNLSVSNNSSNSLPQSAGALADFLSPSENSDDQERLALLWQERKRGTSLSDYPLGPGDVLEISVPDLKEIQKEQIRISGGG